MFGPGEFSIFRFLLNKKITFHLFSDPHSSAVTLIFHCCWKEFIIQSVSVCLSVSGVSTVCVQCCCGRSHRCHIRHEERVLVTEGCSAGLHHGCDQPHVKVQQTLPLFIHFSYRFKMPCSYNIYHFHNRRICVGYDVTDCMS